MSFAGDFNGMFSARHGEAGASAGHFDLLRASSIYYQGQRSVRKLACSPLKAAFAVNLRGNTRAGDAIAAHHDAGVGAKALLPITQQHRLVRANADVVGMPVPASSVKITVRG